MNETTAKATVNRIAAPSGNRDHDYFQPVCVAHNWKGALHSNRTVEGRTLAERDAADHNKVHHADPAPMTEAHTQALELLRGVVDSAHVEQAEALVASGKAAWYFDPQHADVIGLISRATERALAIAYVAEEDVEFAEEFFQTA